VKRLLVVALAAVPLIAVAAPAPLYIPDSVCKWCRRYFSASPSTRSGGTRLRLEVNRIFFLPRGSKAAFTEF